MEGNLHLESVADAIDLRTLNHQANGSSEARDLAVINAQLIRENAQLARERDLLRALIDSLPDRVYAKDRTGRFVFNNPAHARIVGAPSPEAMQGKSDFDYFPKEQAEQFVADERQIIETGRPVINQQQCRANPDNPSEKRWVAATKSVWRDARGEVLGTVGVTRDIDELKKTEEALRQSRDELATRTHQLSRERLLLRTLIDNLPDCVYAKDTEGRKTLANPADLKNLGCKTEAEAIGKSDFDLFPRETAEKFWADDQKVIQGQPVINREEFFLDEQGRKHWLLTCKLPLREPEGNITGLVGIGRDITEQKQAEESLARERNQLRALMDNIPDEIYFKDIDSRFLNLSWPVAKNLGVADPAEAIGKTDFDFFPPDQAREFRADEQKLMQQGEALINKMEKRTSAGGRDTWTSTTKVPLRDKEGKVIGLVGVNRDLTQLKQTEEALRDREMKLCEFTAQLERSNRELQDFAYVASHDLQEPLRKIVVFGERLREKAADRLDAETSDYLQRMQKAASRMQVLINDLLAFSRVTTKAQPFTRVDLTHTAQEVIEDLEARIEMTQGRVELGQLPAIDAEPLQMRQLIQNLIGNALKFRRPEVQPVVKIEAKVFSGLSPQAPPDSPLQDLCELTVSDNGIGFDEKYLDRIFNVFQRLHTRNEYEGTGMGLAIARKIVLHHGGAITARSKPGQGAAFIVTLPLSQPKPNTLHQ